MHLEIIAEALEAKLEKSFSMQRHANVEIALQEDILTLESTRISLKSLGSSKEAAKENEELTQDKHITQSRGRGM